MTSRTAVLVSPPARGPRRGARPLELHVGAGPAVDVAAGAVLVALWVLLWSVFVTGIAMPAARLGPGAPGGESQPVMVVRV